MTSSFLSGPSFNSISSGYNYGLLGTGSLFNNSLTSGLGAYNNSWNALITPLLTRLSRVPCRAILFNI